MTLSNVRQNIMITVASMMTVGQWDSRPINNCVPTVCVGVIFVHSDEI